MTKKNKVHLTQAQKGTEEVWLIQLWYEKNTCESCELYLI